MKKEETLLLLVILILAFFLRLYRLADNPSSLNWDEISHGYNAYSILKTGEDEWGVRWPTIFRAYGDYKLPVYVYLTAVSVKLFGLNEFAVRFPSAIFGVFGVLGTFGLTKALLTNSFTSQGAPPAGGLPRHLRSVPLARLASLIAAFLLAVEPWGLFLSRVAVEANVALCLIIAGAYFFLKGLKSSWPARQQLEPQAIAGGFLVLSSLFFGLSLFTYNSARVFVPLLVVGLVWIYRERWHKGNRRNKGDRGNKRSLIRLRRNKGLQITAGLVFLVFFGAMLVSVLSASGQARYQWVALLDEGAIAQVNQSRGESGLPGMLPVLFHNKGTYFATQFSENYLSHFSPNFLFFKGGSHYQFSVPEFGLLYPVNAPFILIGFWYLLKNRSQASKLILTWLFLAPIASSITRDSPHTLRSIVMLPMWQILTAVGVIGVIRVIRMIGVIRGVVIVGYWLLVIGYLVNFWRVYFGSYRQQYSWAWQYGYKQAVQFIKENYDRYDKIIMTKKYGEPHEFVLFYWPWDPEEYRSDPNLVRYFQTDWYWVDSFDKFEFVNDWEIKDEARDMKQETRHLLITSPGDYPEGWKKVETIYFLDGQPAFEILEN